MPVRRPLLVVSAALFLLWCITRPSYNDVHLAQAPLIEDYSLSVILPVIPSTLASLDQLLAPFLVSTSALYEVAIACPYPLVADIRRTLPAILSNAPLGHPKVSLYPWSGFSHHHQAAVNAIAQAKTQYILLLDEHGFEGISECERAYLVHPRAVHLPVGPRGFSGSPPDWLPLSPSDRAQPAAFLVPPFVVPFTLLANVPLPSRSSLDWSLLGDFIAKSSLAPFGGIVIGTDISDRPACNTATESNQLTFHETYGDDPGSRPLIGLGAMPISPAGFLVIAFPLREDLMGFMPATCKLRQQGYTVLAYIYDAGPSDAPLEWNCVVPYFVPSKGSPNLPDWLGSFGTVPDIIIGLDHQDPVSSTFSLMLERPPFLNTTLMRLPRHQLPYTEWIGTLALHELRRWNVPEITLNVITNDRPYSLQRLLDSIRRTLFYGDKVNIRINMDQTADPETMRVVQDFEWYHGDIFLHHRVILGGLLPAVVESWYPHSNDSYGLLLEDDVELSPLAYAWAKMSLLRYQYGESGPSSKLFGISLYQQKIIELRPTGRQPFDARTLFRSASLADRSPYLSQIPCSWGALYFPAPWREFHDYLSLRLSQSVLPINTTIVPGVRSNKWIKSWKKYFIELVYLRGYVMLYPNYPDFVSLSTNHLEVGSHVKDAPEAVYAKKKHLFLLPLMSLAGALAGGATTTTTTTTTEPRLLDLPGGVLPEWDRLPVLDLAGELASMDAIRKRGEDRRSELGDCGVDVVSLPASVRDLLCRVPV